MQNHEGRQVAAAHAPVLVVNDDRVQLEMLTGILRKSGIACEGLTSAEQALNSMKPEAPPPLVVSDLHMPGIDGWRFCRLLRSHEYAAFNNVPILVVSATFAGGDTREITAATGADAFLPSPIAPGSYLDTVRGLLEGRHLPTPPHALLVTDSQAVCSMLSEAFRSKGHNTLWAANAVQARCIFKEHKPEMVVLDHHLSDGSGEDLLCELSSSTHFSVYVMITDDPDPALALRWMKMGAAACVRKPFEAAYVVALCESAARERTLLCVEEILEQKNRCLSQAQKMETLGQLAGGVAHDFNNLLQIVQGYTDMALMDLDGCPGVETSLLEVLRATEQARCLVEQLLAFSRRQATHPKPTDLVKLIRDELSMVRRIIGEHIILDFQFEQSLPDIHADPHQIEQALLNLCINARDAMTEGGRLLISLRAAEFDAEHCATCRWAAPGQYVCAEIADTGCGMPPEVCERAFEPFFTTKDLGRGTGLGLSSVYGIVKQNNGFIRLQSELGQGTAFQLYLPVYSGQSDWAGYLPPKEIKTEGLGGTESILFAEDDECARALFRMLLEQVGYTVFPAADGDEAVELLTKRATEIDLLLLDVMMPGCGGRKVHEAALAQGLDLPTLFTSGYNHDTLDNRQLPPGANLITKPVQRRELLAAVRKALDRNKEVQALYCDGR